MESYLKYGNGSISIDQSYSSYSMSVGYEKSIC